MSFESNETLSSDDEYAVFSRGASDDESYDDKQYAAYNAKLDADIDLWTSLAAQYEDTDILWPPEPISPEPISPEPISPEPISQYEQEVIRLEYKAADIDTRLALLAQYIWLADYLDKFDADCAAAEEEANAEEYDKTRPIEYRVTSTGRKDRKRKFAHKTTDAAGRVKEDPKHVVKKPNWRKKKTGREHDPALVQRKDFLKDTFECLKLNYKPELYERPLFERGPHAERDWEETTICFWKHTRLVFQWNGDEKKFYF
jgi:hypothetical protein